MRIIGVSLQAHWKLISNFSEILLRSRVDCTKTKMIVFRYDIWLLQSYSYVARAISIF
jgi:hypothetical protein